MTRSPRVFSLLCVLLLLLAVSCTPTTPATTTGGPAATSAAPVTFAGQTIKVLVAGNPGGGVDLNARLFGTYLQKYLPGNPTFTYTAMTGGAGIAVANTLADRSATRPDGLTLGAPGPALPVFQIGGTPGVAFDSAKFEWLGGTTDADTLIYVRSTTGVTAADQLKNRPGQPLVFGATVKTNPAYVFPELLRTDAGWNIRVVPGLGTTGPDVFLAVERGDIQGAYAGYQAMTASKPEWFTNGFIKVIARHGTNEKALEGVPQISDFLPPDARQIVTMLIPGWGRPLVAPPGTPPEIVKAYRDAMSKMVADPAFQAEAVKQGVSTKLVTGEECLEIVKKVLSVPPAVIERYKLLTQG